MKVELLHYTPLMIASTAIRTCWDSGDKSDSIGETIGTKDVELIDRVANKYKHQSTIEVLNYNFYISGISRSVLQELARHRIASYSVKSSRYTLKELKDEKPFEIEDTAKASQYIKITGDDEVDAYSIRALENLRKLIASGVSNDKAKYAMPECYLTELTWTINARSLQNFLALRSSKAALWEIRELAQEIYNALPVDHEFLFRDCMNEMD